jgi:multidrug efflux pump subunit AcrA (membrane-fusion protein)
MPESQEKLDKFEVDAPPDFDHADGRNTVDEEEFLKSGRSQRSQRRQRSWIILTSALLLALILAGTTFAVLRSRGPSPTYRYQKVTLGGLSLSVSATGPLQGNTYHADFAVNGTLSEIDVNVGQHVDENQLLAKLDPSSIVSPPALNKDDYSALKAPHAGIVTAINGAVGGRPGVGDSASGNSTFIQIEDLSSLRIQANVNESDIGKVAQGDKVQFTVSAYGDQIFHGVVSAISPMGQSVSGVVTYSTTIDVNMKELKGLKDVSLLPGMTASVTIITMERSNVVLIPTDAVNFAQAKANQTGSDSLSREQVRAALTQAHQMLLDLQQKKKNLSEDDPTGAYVLERTKNQWVVKPVVLGLTDDTSYEVLAGLSENETIVVGMQGNSTAFFSKENAS